MLHHHIRRTRVVLPALLLQPRILFYPLWPAEDGTLKLIDCLLQRGFVIAVEHLVLPITLPSRIHQFPVHFINLLLECLPLLSVILPLLLPISRLLCTHIESSLQHTQLRHPLVHVLLQQPFHDSSSPLILAGVILLGATLRQCTDLLAQLHLLLHKNTHFLSHCVSNPSSMTNNHPTHSASSCASLPRC